MADVMKNIW